MSKSLPEWNKLTNEVGIEFNEFSIIRGKEFISYGKDIWIGYFCLIDGSGGLEVGDNVTFSSGVHVYTHDSSNYRLYNKEKDPKFGSHIDRAPVKIGNNVQIGANSVVLKGVTIGDNVVIGALSLVKDDIPSNSIAVGNPCKVVKEVRIDSK